MVTYLVLNSIFIIGIILIFRAKLHKPSKVWWITFCTFMLLTLIFDNVIIGLNIVEYNTDKILNIFIGYAPIEDFAYAVLACIIIPLLWNGLSLRRAKKYVE